MIKRTIVLFILALNLLSFTATSSRAAESFSDVSSSYRAYKEIMYLAQGNIVSGNNGNFYPKRNVTRAEAATMLGRVLDLDGNQINTSFKDVSSTSFASGYIQSAVKKGIIAGYANGSFQPNKSVTRGEMALFISRAFGFGSNNSMASAAVQLMNRGIAQGVSNGDFGTNQYITRADYAVFLARAVDYNLRITPTVNFTGSLNVSVSGGLNVRSGPSTAYSVKGTLINGAKVTEAYRVGGWVYVKSPSIEGFVSSNYISSNKPKAEESAPVGNTNPKVEESTSVGTNNSLSSQVLVIDPGHGGSDPGASGYGLLEKTVNLDTGLKLKALLTKTPFKVVMTREADTFPSLSKRVEIAKSAKGNVFISIHSNSFNGNGTGTESFYYSAATNPYVSDSKLLANAIQRRLLDLKDSSDRGVKKGDLHVLRENNMPAALVELGFIDNASDNAKLKSETWRQSAAQAIYWGILDYYKQKGYSVSALY